MRRNLTLLALGSVLAAVTMAGARTARGKSSMQEPGMTARLVDATEKAQERSATVAAHVTGLRLIDPASVHEKAKAGEGHLHYQVDGGPVIATPSTKLSFHELTSGDHKITVVLAGNDHRPLGPQDTLTVKVP
jgi:hypothetical protein